MDKIKNLYAIEVKIGAFLCADSKTDAEEAVINEFGLEELPEWASWDLNVREYQEIEELIKDTKPINAFGMIDEFSEGKLDLGTAQKYLDLVQNIAVSTNLEILISNELQQKLKKIIKGLS